MLGIVFNKKLTLKENIPVPVPKKDEALIRVILAGICNTDLEIIKGYMGFKGILGHEFVGVVEECNDKNWIGKRVVGEINIGCGKCRYCKNGLRNHCPDRKVLGILNKDGAFAEYLTLPIRNLYTMPANISDEEAVFLEPLAACFEVLEQVKIGSRDRVIVLGDGKLGLLMAQVIKNTGCKLYLFGKHEEKLLIAQKLGIKIINLKRVTGNVIARSEATKQSQNKEIATLFKVPYNDIKGVDIVIDCTGSSDGLGLAMILTKPKGKIILKSTFASKSYLNLSPVVINEISIIGSRCGPFKKAIDALKKREIKIEPLIYKIFPFKEGLKAFKMAGEKKALKVLLKYENTSSSPH